MESLVNKIEAAGSLGHTIMETVREPLLILDHNLKIVGTSKSFHSSFQIEPNDTSEQPLFTLDNGAWDIPALRIFMEEQDVVGSVFVEQEFPRIGRRTFLLHARKAPGIKDAPSLILLGFEDITQRRAIESEKALLHARTDDLLKQKEVMLAEMQHRIVNSLQIIASILMLKARAVTSEETRQHLHDAHRRVLSVAAVQQHLHVSGRTDAVEVTPYLTKLCDSLSESMIGESRPANLTVTGDQGWAVPTDAVSLGLIVTELVINALKYAFPGPNKVATVNVNYEVNGTHWKLSVLDNGAGRAHSDTPSPKGGLGTSLVAALAHQLDAQVMIVSSPTGMSVSVTHSTFVARSKT